MTRTTSILASTALLVLGCSGGLAGPDELIVSGQYGAAAVDATLLATHTGVELELGCNGYFAGEQPLVLDANGAFRVRGRFRYGAFVIPREGAATLYGSSGVSGGTFTVTVNLVLDSSGAAGDPFHAILRRGEQYAGVPSPCPL